MKQVLGKTSNFVFISYKMHTCIMQNAKCIQNVFISYNMHSFCLICDASIIKSQYYLGLMCHFLRIRSFYLLHVHVQVVNA